MARIADVQRIHGSPKTSGLDISASRNTIDETQLWELEGVYATPDHTWEKRPEFVQWGTQIMEPTTPDPNNSEEISLVLPATQDTWDDVTITGESVGLTFDHGAIVLSGWQSDPASPGTATTARPLSDGEVYNSQPGFSNDIALSFVIQAKSAAVGVYATLGFAVASNKRKVISITSAGIGVQSGAAAWESISGTASAIDGQPHRIEIYSVAALATLVFIDGVYAGASSSTYVSNTNDNWLEVTAYSDDNLSEDPYSIKLSAFMLRDEVTGAFEAPSLSDITTTRELRTASFTDTFSLFVAGDKYGWLDYGLREIWTPFGPLNKDKTRFSKFRGKTVVCNYADNARETELFLVDGTTTVKLDQAPDLRYTTEYANRVWGAGDVNYPLRLFFSGDRQPNLWYNPSDPTIIDTIDAEEDAGFIDFPGKDNARIRMISSDSFGLLIVATDTDVWYISGTSPRDFEKRRIAGSFNAAGDLCGTDVYNDFWIFGRDGISSIQATQKFGDIQGSKITSLTRGLFDSHNPSGRVLDTDNLHRTSTVYFPKYNTMLFHSYEAAEENPGVIYAMNAETGKWSGPWREQAEVMRVVTLGFPIQDMVAIGTADGKVKYMTPHVSNDDDIKISSAWIDGRSKDPALPSMHKTWKRLRFLIAPTGDWPITVKYKTEDTVWKTKTFDLYDPNKHHILGSTAVATQSLAKSDTQPYVIEVLLKDRGLALKWEITSVAPRFRLLDWGVDFTVGGHEKD